VASPQQPQRVVITGASSGIGAALAQRYAASGATLGLVARRASALRDIAAPLPVRCETYPLDVRDGAALGAAARHFMATHGCPDVVIANAGVSVGSLTEFPEDTKVFEEVMDTNVIGMVNTFQPFIAPMRERGSGSLAGIASVAGYRGLPGAAAYSASKAAVISYLESLRVELHASGVNVITICLGYVATPMTEEAAAKIVSLIARGRRYAVIPWQMAVVARALRVMPNWLYDRVLAGVPHKPRRGRG
jgi:short-subunit dehydrogenase